MVFSCYIAGEGTLPIQCAEVLLLQGHSIYGVISDENQLVQWATSQQIPVTSPEDALSVVLASRPFDYLFTIVCSHILSPEIIAAARKRSINYHDGPLPAYAGSHATSWALYHREVVHGITWHEVAERVDSGDILRQREISIDPEDTAFTLNTKCYVAAIGEFTELVGQLASGQEQASPQSLAERTFYKRSKRFPQASIVSWKDEAECMEASVRALDFGNYVNPLGHVRLLVANGEFVIVRALELLESKSDESAGTVLAIDDDRISVSTKSHDIQISKLATVDGRSLPITEFAVLYDVVVGHCFHEMPCALAERVETLNHSVARHESIWVDRLCNLHSIDFPYVKTSGAFSTAPPSHRYMTGEIPGEFVDHASSAHPAVPPVTVLTAAFVAFLSRLDSKEHSAIGFADRILAKEMEGLDGLFSSYVPLPVDVNHADGFAVVVQKMDLELNFARRHGTYARDVFLRYPQLNSSSTQVDPRRYRIAVESANDLLVNSTKPCPELALIVSDGVKYRWKYNERCLSESSIAQVQSQFEAFLRGIAARPDTRVSELPLLSEYEQALLEDWNATSRDYLPESTLGSLFEAQVEKAPDEPALMHEGQSLSYGELNARANQLARVLRDRGVGPEVLVGICAERSIEMVVAVLAVFKAGGAYVPLDPSYPAERLLHMLEDAQVSLILVQPHLKERLPPTAGDLLLLDAGGGFCAEQPAGNLPPLAGPENLAYVIFTSGSTGRAKGAMNEHRGICNQLQWMVEEFALSAEDRVLQRIPFGFDPSVLEICLPLLSGAGLVMAGPDGHRDSAYLVRKIQGSGITSIVLVPSMLRVFLEEPGVENCVSLKQVICGGEVLTHELQERFYARLPGAALYNVYGPTETGVQVCYWRCRQGDESHPVPIGHPVANTQLRILDAQLQAVPVGIAGELHIGGVQVGRGYVGRAELTLERFVADPFCAQSGARLYKTGDLVRQRADGAIEYLGRLDQQIKLRGQRIELGEIEVVLEQQPGVGQSAVIVREDTPGNQILVAYVMGTEMPSAAELRASLSQVLPAYMIPGAFMFLDALPLSPSGKVDIKALPEPEVELLATRATYTAPRNSTESRLVGLYADILNVSNVSIHDNFLDLGGHSLQAVRLVAEIRQNFGIEMPLQLLFSSSTILQLSNHLLKQTSEAIVQPQSAGLVRRKRIPVSRPRS